MSSATLSLRLLLISLISISVADRPYLSDGGWKTYVSDIEVEAGPCNIDIVDQSITNEIFLQRYAYNQPFVLRHASNNNLMRALTVRDRLLTDFGSTSVTLSSANSYSYDKLKVDLKHYINNMLKPRRRHEKANETFYFFGDHDPRTWQPLLDEYVLPPLHLPKHSPALSFGLGGPGSGVPFHFHGPGFAESLHGRKRWFLTRPQETPNFDPNKTTVQWMHEDYEKVKGKMDIFECTLQPGEVIYFPDKWWHATLNIDTSVFVSTFLSP